MRARSPRIRKTRARKLAKGLGVECLEARYLLTSHAPDVDPAENTCEVACEIEPQYHIKHPPRIQLGNAPLIGYPGSENDQIDILWQTIPAGAGSQDSFIVDVRAVGGETWTLANSMTLKDLDFEGRINHEAQIRGLDFDSAYEYRVQHLRAGEIVETYQTEFKTRLRAGDQTPFTFAAYGDSAYLPEIENFRAVQHQINQRDTDFTLLLGDNVYNFGELSEYDGRFDPMLAPEATAWTASHIDYLAIGNHDGSGARWVNTAASFSVPIPEAGVNSPAAPSLWPQETAYSFDYGNVHFLTFNSNYYRNPAVLEHQMDYATQVFAESDAQWKIVFSHHALAAAPDKGQVPGDDYYRIVAPRLEAAGVDLLLVGHSHTYSWSRPMLGQSDGKVVFVPDDDKDYDKDAGLIQVVSGVGGKSLRPGRFPTPFVAAGFSTQTSPSLEFGYTEVQVTPNQLTVSYIAADDGNLIDQFKITDRTNQPTQIDHVFVSNDAWSSEFLDQFDDSYVVREDLGIEITRGEGQRQPLPWNTLNQISVEFTGPFDVTRQSMIVRDLYTDRLYAFEEQGFSYDSQTHTATWTLTEPLASGIFVMELLEGESPPEPDGNDEPPIPLRADYFPFAVLHADVDRDGKVSAADVHWLRAAVGQPMALDYDGQDVLSHEEVDHVIEALLQPVAGDANLDGAIDFADFLILSQYFGIGHRWVQGDFDADDDVDFADFLLLSAQFTSDGQQ